MEEACRRGDLEAIKQLARQDPEVITRPDAIGVTPLHRAAAANHLHVARFLLAHGAQVNAVDKYNDAPLKKAAFRGFSDFVVFLVHQGADVNHKDGSGKIALHHSAEQGQLHILELSQPFGVGGIGIELREALGDKFRAALSTAI